MEAKADEIFRIGVMQEENLVQAIQKQKDEQKQKLLQRLSQRIGSKAAREENLDNKIKFEDHSDGERFADTVECTSDMFCKPNEFCNLKTNQCRPKTELASYKLQPKVDFYNATQGNVDHLLNRHARNDFNLSLRIDKERERQQAVLSQKLKMRENARQDKDEDDFIKKTQEDLELMSFKLEEMKVKFDEVMARRSAPAEVPVPVAYPIPSGPTEPAARLPSIQRLRTDLGVSNVGPAGRSMNAGQVRPRSMLGTGGGRLRRRRRHLKSRKTRRRTTSLNKGV
jgi:hypothetical protein